MRQEEPRRIAVILNPGSRAVDADLGVGIRREFVALGIDPEIRLCAGGDEIRGNATEALRSGSSVLVAGGGDGTVSTVASVVADSDAALGILPLGTLNHFARDLAVPLDLREAVAAVVEGHAIRVDLGEVNGRTFLNNSSLGIYPMIVRYRDARQQGGRSKGWAFVKAVLAALGRYPFLEVRIASQETELVRRTPFLFVGNNEYEIQGLKMGSRARMDSGMLSVHVAHPVGRLGLVGLALRGLLGRLRDADSLDSLSARELEVAVRSPRLSVALDGEVVLLEPPLRYRCRSRALRVLVPAGGPVR